MSKISADDVKKLAVLSGLTVKNDEVQSLAKELEAILGYFEQLNSINTDGVLPTYQVTGLKNVTRTDQVIDYGVDQQALLVNAPAKTDNSIRVKKVL